jgi:hypothetical protein
MTRSWLCHTATANTARVARITIAALRGSATRASVRSQAERCSRLSTALSAYSLVKVNSEAASGSITRLVTIL